MVSLEPVPMSVLQDQYAVDGESQYVIICLRCGLSCLAGNNKLMAAPYISCAHHLYSCMEVALEHDITPEMVLREASMYEYLVQK